MKKKKGARNSIFQRYTGRVKKRKKKKRSAARSRCCRDEGQERKGLGVEWAVKWAHREKRGEKKGGGRMGKPLWKRQEEKVEGERGRRSDDCFLSRKEREKGKKEEEGLAVFFLSLE